MYHNVLVPISFDPERDVTGPLKVARLLSAPGANVTLLHVIEQVPAYAISYIPADFMDGTRSALQAELDGLAKTLPNARGELVEGHSGRTILDWAEQNQPDLIILASHRPSMQDLLWGSTSGHVVRHAACAVHVVR
ncbi:MULTISPECIES: universal stress protein [unclassified Leisingera]|uniref:universal stress protein n=1 Tax=unclassified Leisingera TaxID=2614906 RepID=UPI000A8AC04D|nr:MULTISPECIES: universal stress protein [unclassified Leisingera]MBQ4825235.1 universal stress protein [Leisingera sp. HS039]MCF6430259.1 universal stress protein [Leisingera sp. MMG026]QBR35076.1 universal stress protein [Leisingera sp. NJS201]UWQ29236.1 universal stress protein [Leisingera sp. M523]UWQ74179.1 universal stress protein [Leisingera sp. M658]